METENKKPNFELACEKLGIDPTKTPDVSLWPEEDQKRILADYRLSVIYKAQPDNKKSHVTKLNRWKSWPAFGLKKDEGHPSGFGFSGSSYGSTSTSADLGSRFAFEEPADAIAFGEDNQELCKDYLLTPPTV